MDQYLWVYGTLRHGESNHHFLTGCSFMGMAYCPGSLFSVQSHYPVFQPHSLTACLRGVSEVNDLHTRLPHKQSQAKSVLGEIYQIQSELWPRLDELEGVEEGYYRRASFPVSSAIVPGEAQALVYVVGPLLESFCREEHRIASGDWCQSSFPL